MVQLKDHYDWDALKYEFLKGPWATAADFRQDKGLVYPKKSRGVCQNIAKHMMDWDSEKKALMAVSTKKASLTLVDDKVDQFKKVRARQAKLARLMQEKGRKALDKMEPENSEDARKLMLTGLEQERLALGLNEKGGTQNLTQVNVNLPKTKFDQILDGQDFEQLLDFIAEIKRERARRTGADSALPEQAGSGG